MADTRKAENEVTRTGLYWPGKRTEVERVALPFQVVETVNVSRATREEAPLFAAIQGDEAEGWRNKLIWGENKYIMASLLDQGFAGKINLIYIDPPFATGADFSVNIKVGDEEWTKEASVIEEKAYRDTWGKGLDSYLQMMYDRLVLMRELLAEDGTIYVHVAYHVGHYVKVILDEIFGKDNLRNEIIWYYNSGPRAALDFGRRHDTILRYSRTDTYKLNADEVREAYSPNINIPASKAHYYHPLGKVADDVWRINIISQNDKRERLDFPTQKPEALLERIIKASSNPSDLVADFFCVRKGTRVLTPRNPPVNGGTSPSPLTGRAGVGLIPIENLHPGDWVIAHDGQPHRVLRVIRKHHRGQMVGIRHNLSPKTLWVTEDHRVLCQKRTLSYGAQRTWKHVPPEHFPRSRELRKDMTAAERVLWQGLRGEQLGVKFRRQHPIGPYIVDFYSWEAGLVVEVDGDSHFTPEGQEYDAARTEYLQALGLEVMRFTNDNALNHREAVLERIFESAQEVMPCEHHYRQSK